MKLIAPEDEKGVLWCYSCAHLSTSKSFCLKGQEKKGNCAYFERDNFSLPCLKPERKMCEVRKGEKCVRLMEYYDCFLEKEN